MKFLAFNILVGAALAWLFLGGDNAQALLTSLVPSSDSPTPAAVHCSAPAYGVTANAESRQEEASPLSAPVTDGVPVSIRSTQLASIPANLPANPRRSEIGETRAAAPTRLAAATPGVDPSPKFENAERDIIQLPDEKASNGASRRDTLRSLAESMELFSLERIGK